MTPEERRAHVADIHEREGMMLDDGTRGPMPEPTPGRVALAAQRCVATYPAVARALGWAQERDDVPPATGGLDDARRSTTRQAGPSQVIPAKGQR